MSFYVTRNSSKKDFPDNSLTHFTTKLGKPIKLEGEYEVSLVEMIYPKNWKYRADGFIQLFGNFDEKYPGTSVKVEFFVNESFKELIVRLNNLISLTDIVIELEYNELVGKMFLQIPEKCKVVFTNGIEAAFGFTESSFIGEVENNQVRAYHSQNIVNTKLNKINSLYIYTDIVEYQIVGDVNAPLLQVVSTSYDNANIVEKIYDAPHYIPVLRNNIETIEIDIRSDLGEKIHFQSGQVIIKLHFRRKNFYFS